MVFKKGDVKPVNSGRKKGTKNKLNIGVAEALNDRNIDCVEELINIAQTTEKDDLRFAVYKELLKYVFPQRKAVEMDVNTIEMPKIDIEGI